MIKELCHDEAILSQRCEVATVEDESVAQDLIDTIKSLDDAGCLAANQIGVTKKVCVYLDDAGEPHVLYNPRLVFGLGASKMEESCLTHEEVTKSTRYIKCKVAFDQIVDGKMRERKQDFVGFEAQMVQHMIDHCLGKLFYWEVSSSLGLFWAVRLIVVMYGLLCLAPFCLVTITLAGT